MFLADSWTHTRTHTHTHIRTHTHTHAYTHTHTHTQLAPPRADFSLSARTRIQRCNPRSKSFIIIAEAHQAANLLLGLLGLLELSKPKVIERFEPLGYQGYSGYSRYDHPHYLIWLVSLRAVFHILRYTFWNCTSFNLPLFICVYF